MVHHHVHLEHRRGGRGEHRGVTRGRHREHRAGQVILHQSQQRGMLGEIVTGGFQTREHQLKAKRAHRLRVLIRGIVQRDERAREPENLEHARQTEGFAVRCELVRRSRRVRPRADHLVFFIRIRLWFVLLRVGTRTLC